MDVTSELFPIMSEKIPMPDSIRSAIAKAHNSQVGHVGVLRTERRLRHSQSQLMKMNLDISTYSTVIDNFSRWVMTYPCKTMETIELVRNLIILFGIFGLPLEFLTDNGSNLKAELVEEICNMLRIDRKIVSCLFA